MINLSNVLSIITSMRYPHALESMEDYLVSVCGFDISALATADNVLGEDEPTKETIETYKLHVPFFGIAVEEIINSVNEVKSAEDFPVIKWRGFAQSMKIVMLCISDPDWVEAHKDMFGKTATV